MRIYFLLMALSIFTTRDMTSQCNFFVDVPQDITICEPQSINLNGIIYGNYLEFNWTSNQGYYNNQELSPSVFVNQTTTFKLKAYGDPIGNLIVNGDFSQGNFGFTSNYSYQEDVSYSTTELWSEGTYSVTDNPNKVHTYFSACSDHTGGGNMMVVNGAPSYAQVWCQTINVTPNTPYVFQAFATSVEPTNPAILQFSINGNLLGQPFNLQGGTACNWQEFYEIWESGSNTSVNICVTNQNTVASGNDFAIDDIYFGPICNEEKEFTVTISDFDIDIQGSPVLDCLNSHTDITANSYPYNSLFYYNWETDGGIIESNSNSSTITVSASGIYNVTVTDQSGCSREETIQIFDNSIVPDLTILGNPVIDCAHPSTTLSGSSNVSISEYQWQLPDGSAANSSTLEVSTAGIYGLTITSSQGCTTSKEIEVIRDIPNFQYNTSVSQPLTCSIDTTIITLLIDSPISQIQWEGPGIVSQNTSHEQIIVNAPGFYSYTLSLDTECHITDSIEVVLTPPLYDYKLPIPDTITCLLQEIKMAPVSIIGIENIRWMDSDDIISTSDSLDVSIGGTYYFTVTDINGCEKSDSITVIDDLLKPIFSVTVDTIDCVDNLGGFLISYSGDYKFNWTGPGGNSDADNPTFEVDDDYELIVTAENGCRDTVVYFLPSSIDFPIITAEIKAITCGEPEGNISLFSSLPSSFSWSSVHGESGTDSVVSSVKGGVFNVSVTADNGCKSEMTFELPFDTLAPLLGPIDDFTLTCKETEYQPTITSENYDSFSWIGPGLDIQSPIEPIITLPGEFTLTIYGTNGCPSKTTFNVDQNITAPTFSLSASSETLTCAEPEILLTIDSDEDLTYTLNDEAVSHTDFTITEPGTYIVIAINNLGCESSLTQVIDAHFETPDISLNPILLTCAESEVWIKNMGADSDLELFWNSGMDVISTQDSILITENIPITLIAFNEYGCSSTVEAVIHTDFEAPDFVIKGSPEIGCHDEFTSLVIESDHNLTYIWQSENGQKISESRTLDVYEIGNYQVIVTDINNGCTHSDGIEVTKQPSPEVVIFTDADPLCYGEKGQFVWQGTTGGIPPYTLNIAGQEIKENTSFALYPGQYNILVTDINGCTVEDRFSISDARDFYVDAGRDTTIRWGESYTLNPFVSINTDEISDISWSYNQSDILCSQCFQHTISPTVTTTYMITVIDLNGCERTDKVTVRVEFIKGYLAPNIFRPDSRIGNGKFTVYSKEKSIEDILSLRIYDRWGNLIFKTENIPPDNLQYGWDGTFNGRDVQPGVFVWVADIVYKDGSTEVGKGDITVVK